MKILIVAVAVLGVAYAGHHDQGSFQGPQVISQSDKEISCPHGFKQHGKECIHTVVTKPSVFCPNNFIRYAEKDDVCVQFFEKKMTCPAEYVHEKGACYNQREVPPLVECPEGYTILHDGRQCARSVRMPNKFFCPHGTVQRHDACVKKVPVQPELVCPKGLVFTEDGRCRAVEVYDCSPEKVHTGKEAAESHKKHKKLRLLGEKKKHSTVSGKEVEVSFVEEEEFVTEKTCKRVRIESAHKVCPKHSVHQRDGCVVEEEVPMVEEHGKFREEVVKAKFFCPHGHVPSSSIGRFSCTIREEVPVHGYCPDNSEDVGGKCALFKPLRLKCPSDHVLKDGLCSKVIIAPPIVEFQQTLRCVGKDCGHSHESSKHHK